MLKRTILTPIYCSTLSIVFLLGELALPQTIDLSSKIGKHFSVDTIAAFSLSITQRKVGNLFP